MIQEGEEIQNKEIVDEEPTRNKISSVSSGWLNQVKGKITKSVEERIRQNDHIVNDVSNDGDTHDPQQDEISDTLIKKSRFTLNFLRNISEKGSNTSDDELNSSEQKTMTEPCHDDSNKSFKERVIGLVSRSGQPSSSTKSRKCDDTHDSSSTIQNVDNDVDESYELVEEATEAIETQVYDPQSPQPNDSNFLIGHTICDDDSDIDDITFEQCTQESSYSILENYWYIAALPLCSLVIFHSFPLPNWLLGFLTGLFCGLTGIVFILYFLFVCKFGLSNEEMEERNEKLKKYRRVPKSTKVAGFDDLEREYIWMNMWPSRNGEYDPVMYDVRKTVTVRVMLHGPWMELKFPRRNLPFRRSDNVQESFNVTYLQHKEVIDLTKCEVEIVPQNLPPKRLWSKKYPICVKVPNSVGVSASIPNSSTDDDKASRVSGDGNVGENRTSTRSFFLFTRTGREKEEWFNRLKVCAGYHNDRKDVDVEFNDTTCTTENDFSSSYTSQTNQMRIQTFKLFMENYFQALHDEGARKVHTSTTQSLERRQTAREQMAFLNIFMARIWYDLHNSKQFVEDLRLKLSKKLSKVKIAHYFDDVTVSNLELGQSLPQILSVSLPWQDRSGLWFYVDLEYSGSQTCNATVETRGIRLPSKDQPDREAVEIVGGLRRKVVLEDGESSESPEDDSAEEDDTKFTIHGQRSAENREQDIGNVLPPVLTIPSSVKVSSKATTPTKTTSKRDDNSATMTPPRSYGDGGSSGMIDGILKSQFVAKMAEKEWVKRRINNTNLTLRLQVHSLKGTLVINVPPAPSNRLWYSFTSPPQLNLTLQPLFQQQVPGSTPSGSSTSSINACNSSPSAAPVGSNSMAVNAITRQMEKLLILEFNKILVMPNMDDFILPFLNNISH